MLQNRTYDQRRDRDLDQGCEKAREHAASPEGTGA
jgi:hypothetical protein